MHCLFIATIPLSSPFAVCTKTKSRERLHNYIKSEFYAMDDDYDSSAFCRMLKMAGLPDKTIQHTLDNGVMF